MNDTVFYGNILSGIGAFLLLLGYFLITIKNDEQKGFCSNAFGSLFMCFAYYMLDSPAYLILNAIWIFISINGYRNRKNEKTKITESNKYIINSVYLILVLPSIFFIITNNPDNVSWCSIFLMLTAYTLFSFGKIKKMDYVIFLALANLFGLFHMIDIQSYSSMVHITINVSLSIYSIYKDRKTRVPLKA